MEIEFSIVCIFNFEIKLIALQESYLTLFHAFDMCPDSSSPFTSIFSIHISIIICAHISLSKADSHYENATTDSETIERPKSIYYIEYTQ